MQKKTIRAFKISCGLREGYEEPAVTHSISEARSIIQKWIEERMSNDKKVAVGTLIYGEFIYPFKEGDVTFSRFEPAFHYQGRMREDATDTEAEEMLTELAEYLSRELKQKTVHIEFGSEHWAVEN